MMMAIMAVLIVVVFSVVCFVNYQQSLNTVYMNLDEALKHANTKNEMVDENGPPPNKQNGQRFEFGGRHQNDILIPISVYRITEAHDVAFVNSTSPYELSEDILESAIQTVLNVPEGNGTLPSLGLVYTKRAIPKGALVAFADDSSTFEWVGLAKSLTVIGLVTLLAFLGISILLSKRALKPVEEAWKNQQRFISDASHELKTPLTVISANVSILQKNMDKTIASQSQWVESTEEEIANMRELVDDMLFIASADESIAKSENERGFEPVNLSKILDGQVLQFDALAYENNITLEAAIEENIWIQGNKARLQRFIRTLLDNAYKYSTGKGTIDIALAKSSTEITLSVHNSEGFIEPEDLPHVFERFYRADKARVREAGSYGLGLSIAHDIVSEHGGKLTVTSSPQSGTTFAAIWNNSIAIEAPTSKQ